MPYVTGRDLKQDILFRSGETTGGNSAWDTKVLDYLNRAYRTLADGSSEFLPEYVNDWWWMKEKSSLILEPAITDSLLNLQSGSTDATISPASSDDLTGWYVKVDGWPDVFVISVHGGGSSITLDQPWTGETNATAAANIMKVIYDLGASVASLLSPMIAYRDVSKIEGMDVEAMDVNYPLIALTPGNPLAFALENESQVRFSHGGRSDGVKMRVDYRYKPLLDDLVDTTTSIPLVPQRYRHVLCDMALAFLMTDKNDGRAQSYLSSARAGVTGMYKENRHRRVKMSGNAGHIYPRQRRSLIKGPLRTESGLIIG